MDDRRNGRYKVGQVGVDAGMVMVGDPCYLSGYGKKSTDGFEWVETEVETQKASGRYDYSYSGACAATLSDHSAGQLGIGDAVAVSSGYGDGVYPVYATYNHEGRITKLEVVFVAEEDDDYEVEDEDEEEQCEGCGDSFPELNADNKCEDCAEADEEDDE